MMNETKPWICEGRSPNERGVCPCGCPSAMHMRAGMTGPVQCERCVADRLSKPPARLYIALDRTGTPVLPQAAFSSDARAAYALRGYEAGKVAMYVPESDLDEKHAKLVEVADKLRVVREQCINQEHGFGRREAELQRKLGVALEVAHRALDHLETVLSSDSDMPSHEADETAASEYIDEGRTSLGGL